MPTPVSASLPDDPALLRVDGPIATITLNRPAAFNSIDLSIAKKLEQLSADVEASDDIRVLVIEGRCANRHEPGGTREAQRTQFQRDAPFHRTSRVKRSSLNRSGAVEQ